MTRFEIKEPAPTKGGMQMLITDNEALVFLSKERICKYMPTYIC
jgi:hypothetical protein